MDEVPPRPQTEVSSSEGISMGLRRSSKYSFHRWTISLVEKKKQYSPEQYTMWEEHHFPLLSRLMVSQNCFNAIQKSLSSPNSFQIWIFASATARAAYDLSSWYPSAVSKMPQANQGRTGAVWSQVWTGGNENQLLQIRGHGPRAKKGGVPTPGQGWVAWGLVHELAGGWGDIYRSVHSPWMLDELSPKGGWPSLKPGGEA